MNESSKPHSNSAPARLSRGGGIINGRVGAFLARQHERLLSSTDHHGTIGCHHDGRHTFRLRKNLDTRREVERSEA